jgi:hypothetical protein
MLAIVKEVFEWNLTTKRSQMMANTILGFSLLLIHFFKTMTQKWFLDNVMFSTFKLDMESISLHQVTYWLRPKVVFPSYKLFWKTFYLH